MELDWRKKAGEVLKWEYEQNTLDLKVNGISICKYCIDFKVWLADGSIEYVEVKGFPTPLWKLKWKILQATQDEVIEENARIVLVK